MSRDKSNKIRAKVHRLPTEDKSQIHYNKVKYPTEIRYELSFHKEPSKCKNDGLCSGNQHLYITTDDKIKEGDWYIIQGASPEGVYNTLPNGGVKKEFAKKIIATNDPKLILGCKAECGTDIDMDNCPNSYVSYGDQYFPKGVTRCKGRQLPQPTQDFIKAYCEQGGIEEVLVEHKEYIKCTNCNLTEEDCECNVSYTQDLIGIDRVKLNPDNTIIIHPVEEMYTADSINTLRKLANAIIGPASEILPDTYDKELKAYWDWIEENL